MQETSSIIRLTDRAAAHIQVKIAEKSEAVGFRLAVKQTGCSGYMYVVDVVSEAKAGDITQTSEQGILLFIASEAIPLVRGTEIDFVKKALGMEMLEFNNPQAEGLCGCGESFTIREG